MESPSYDRLLTNAAKDRTLLILTQSDLLWCSSMFEGSLQLARELWKIWRAFPPLAKEMRAMSAHARDAALPGSIYCVSN